MAEVVEVCVLPQVVFSPLRDDWEGIYFSVGVELLISVSAGNVSSILYKSTLIH